MILRTLSRSLPRLWPIVTIALSCACSAPSSVPAAPGPLSHNLPLAARPKEHLYVARTTYTPSESEVLVYAQNSSKPVATITKGVQSGFAGTGGLAVDPAGNLYIANYSADSIAVYKPGKTTPSYTITKGLDVPYAMAFDSAGNLYVTNCPNCAYYDHTRASHGSVSVYPHGKTVPSYSIVAGIDDPVALTIDASGNLYVANCPTAAAPVVCTGNYYIQSGDGSVVVYPRGKKIPSYRITNGVDAPRSIAIDSSGNLYVANIGDDDIAVYPVGAITPAYSIWLGLFDAVLPTSLVFDNDKNLYVAVCSFDRICVFPPKSASPIAEYPRPPNYIPRILIFDRSQNLYVLEQGSDAMTGLPNHNNEVAVFEYAPKAATPFREVLTGANYATAMAIGP